MGNKSKGLYEEAQKIIPGGVNSPVRAFKSVGGTPLFIAKASGSKIYDVDGKEYIDYVCSWGPMILGHARPRLTEALKRALDLGTSYGAPTRQEVILAQMICEAMPSIEMVRLVSSGTEATMSALRLARGYTKRDKILKFEGCYHGHADALLVKAGSGAITLGIPDSAGVPAELAKNTITAPYNDLAAVKEILRQDGSNIAAVIVEPVAGNMGVVPPLRGFLEGLRELTLEHGVVLIFDEVITGFRMSYGGAQEMFGVRPDLTCLGKIIGGGLPVGAFGGKREIMEMLAPLGPVYQAGTLSGNPLAVTAGIETLKLLAEPKFYDELKNKAITLEEGLKDAANRAGVSACFNRVCSMMTCFFTEQQAVVDYATAKTSDTKAYAKFFWAMLERGVYLAPSQFEAAFVSAAHTMRDIANTVKAAEEAFKEVKE